ncbi:poly-gamma-glutamate biosynthesis protein PgsC/CapC [Arsenicicoccus dermatophilus]|uniref:poly-gamma-glutamate biosynthesis protein PgsC/CapC n=1 Tax=Arsenicicoccus dermatophilus TaxID=1076331 RepID=UPI003916E9AB
MPEYTFTPEVVRITVLVGVVLSMLVYERIQLTTGGAIVPAYLALALGRPVAVAVTLGIGHLTFVLVNRVIGRRRILYGRRKFEIEVLVGLGLVMVTALAARALGHLDPSLAGITGIGFLVPGIIAHDMARQRPGRTVLVVLATTAFLGVVAWLASVLLAIAPGAALDQPMHLASVTGYPREILLYAVALSVLVGMVVFSRLGLRSGGFVTGAYLALVGPRWSDLAFTAVVALVTWALVVHVLMPRLLLFGRRKLAAMLLVGSVVAWSVEIVMTALSQGDFIPWRGLTAATVVVPSLIANDAQRQGWERTVWGTTLTATGVYAGACLVAAATMTIGGLP